MLSYAPAGAEAVVELDVARMRTNHVLGPLVAAAGTLLGEVGFGFHAIRDADVIVL